jgi:hypothetical protein
LSLTQRIRTKALLEADLLKLRLRHGRTLAALTSGGPPYVLVVSLNEFVYQLKLEAMIAKAVELRGLTPVFLVPAGSKLAPRYLERFGIRKLVRLTDYVDDDLARRAHADALALLDGELTVASLANLRYHNAAVGRFVLSTVSRALHEGAVDLADPETQRFVEEQLSVAVRSTLAAEAILDELQPEAVLFIERNYAAEAPLSDLALDRRINVVQFVASARDDAFVFKRYTQETRRMHPRSLADESWERVKALPWTPQRDAELEDEFHRRYDKSNSLARRRLEWTSEGTSDEVRAQLGLDSGKKTAVVYSHILWDANMFYGEDLFADQEAWFVATVRAACENPRANWVVKLHPDNVWKRRRDGLEGEVGEIALIRERIGELPEHVKLLRPETPIGTRSLFDVTDVGVTIRGSVGIELPCFGVPVLTAGTGFYTGRGFTIDSSTAEEYLARLAHVEEIPRLTPQQVELARRHAHALFCLRPTRITTFRTVIRPLAEMGHPLDHDLLLQVRSRAELERAGDLQRLGRWIVGSRELDYLKLTEAD